MKDIIKMKNKRGGVLLVFFIVLSLLLISDAVIINEIKKANNFKDNSKKINLGEVSNGLTELSFLGNQNANSIFSGKIEDSNNRGRGVSQNSEEFRIYKEKILQEIVPDKTPEKRLEEIKKEIKETGADWEAGLTPVAMLSVENKRKLLGGSIIMSDSIDMTSVFGQVFTESGSSTLPSYFNWHDRNGIDWMTPVKSQGGCGSCWAFASIGVIEAMFNIFENNPNLDLDLSEQQLVSNDGVCCSSCGDCNGGSEISSLFYAKKYGLVKETCFPYTASNTSCNLCENWNNEKYLLKNYFLVQPNTTEGYKNAIMNYGPLTAAIFAGDMFLYYVGGIYQESEKAGFNSSNHVVVLVGWNDTENSWIIKNSWSVYWGDKGYGKITYGDIERHGQVFAAIPSVEKKCSLDSDCGINKETNFLYCSLENVFQSSLNYTCNNPGTPEAFCSNSTTITLKQDCREPFSDFFRGNYSGDFGGNYCISGNVYHNKTNYNLGCSGGFCFNNSGIEEQKIKDCGNETCNLGQCENVNTIVASCNFACSSHSIYDYCTRNREVKADGLNFNTTCIELAVNSTFEKYNVTRRCLNFGCPGYARCYKNSDCGTDGFIGNLFCLDNNVFQNSMNYTCNNPGTLNSSCSNLTSLNLKQDCGENSSELWESNYCNLGDVYHKRNKYNTGCSGGFCFNNSNIEEQKVEDCQFGCENSQCKKPDLTIIDLIIQKINSREVTLAFTIKNIGKAIADDVYWMIDTNSSDKSPKRTTPINLNADEFTRAYMKWNYSFSGNYNPKVIVDFQNLINESNETNNEAFVSVGV